MAVILSKLAIFLFYVLLRDLAVCSTKNKQYGHQEMIVHTGSIGIYIYISRNIKIGKSLEIIMKVNFLYLLLLLSGWCFNLVFQEFGLCALQFHLNRLLIKEIDS